MKYETLAELKAAYDNGELSRESVMTLDNDSTHVYEATEDDDGPQVFEGGMPQRLLEEALTLLGIPWQNA